MYIELRPRRYSDSSLIPAENCAPTKNPDHRLFNHISPLLSPNVTRRLWNFVVPLFSFNSPYKYFVFLGLYEILAARSIVYHVSDNVQIPASDD